MIYGGFVCHMLSLPSTISHHDGQETQISKNLCVWVIDSAVVKVCTPKVFHIDTYRWQSQALWVFNVCYSLTKSIICLCSLKIRVLILHWISLYTLTLKVINCIRVCIEIYVPHKHTGRLTLLYRTLCLIGTEPADMWATLMALTFIISSSVAQPSTGAKVN